MPNTRQSTPPAPQFRQAAIPTCGHANNANNFSYEKTPLRYNLVRTPDLAAQLAIKQTPPQLQLRPVAVPNSKLHRYATCRFRSHFSYETKNRPSLWRTSQSWSVAGQASIQCQSHAPGMPSECTGSATGMHRECHGNVTGTLCHSASFAQKQPTLTPVIPAQSLPPTPVRRWNPRAPRPQPAPSLTTHHSHPRHSRGGGNPRVPRPQPTPSLTTYPSPGTFPSTSAYSALLPREVMR